MGDFLNKTISKLTGIDLSDCFGKESDSLSTLGVIVREESWIGRGTWVSGGYAVAALNFLTPIISGSYVELFWSKTESK